MLQLGLVVTPTTHISVVKNDPDDDKFLEAAISGEAHCIVSQDKHLLSLREFRTVKILKPEEFLAEIKWLSKS